MLGSGLIALLGGAWSTAMLALQVTFLMFS